VQAFSGQNEPWFKSFASKESSQGLQKVTQEAQEA
jgi:hypothetical protein